MTFILIGFLLTTLTQTDTRNIQLATQITAASDQESIQHLSYSVAISYF